MVTNVHDVDLVVSGREDASAVRGHGQAPDLSVGALLQPRLVVLPENGQLQHR